MTSQFISRTMLSFVIMAGFLSGYCKALTIHVPGDYQTLTEAIQAASSGDTILVADGVYTGALNKNLAFGNKSLTLISENGSDECIIDCENEGRAIFRSDEIGSVVIQGFTIRNGNGDLGHGGGLYNAESDIHLRDCRFENCTGMNGGGIFLSCFDRESHFEMDNCRFQNNTANGDGGGAYVFNAFEVSISVDDCHFNDNNCTGEGGGLWAENASAKIVLTNSSFYGNQADWGGGAMLSSGTVDACILEENYPTGLSAHVPLFDILITRSSFIRNGWGIYIDPIQKNIHITRLLKATVGGSLEKGNIFIDNYYPAIYTHNLFDNPYPVAVQASHNTFGDYQGSRYVSQSIDPNLVDVDLTNCKFLADPLYSDVYVSPDGDDMNSGLSADKPFRTLSKAARTIKGTASKPRTIFLLKGTYLIPDTYERIDRLNLEHVSIQGMGQDLTILDFDERIQGLGGYCVDTRVSDLSIRKALKPATDFRGESLAFNRCMVTDNLFGGAEFCLDQTVQISDCVFENNQNGSLIEVHYGLCAGADNVIISDSIIRNNTCAGIIVGAETATIWNVIVDTNFWYGLTFDGSHLNLMNSLFTGNGKAVWLEGDGPATVVNCSFINNISDGEMGTGFMQNSNVRNCTIRGNSLQAGKHLEMRRYGNSVYEIGVRFSNIEGAADGIYVQTDSASYFKFENNFDADPLFVTGPKGDFYLSHKACGQSADSPCIDSGSVLASDICFNRDPYTCLSDMTTRTDELSDSGQVDVGYHYSATKTFNGVPELRLKMPRNFYQSGDPFRLDLHCKSGVPNLEQIHLFVALEIAGQLWFHPDWRCFEPPDYPVSYSTVWIRDEIRNIIPEFTWPDTGATADGLHFIALCVDLEMSDIISNIDVISWGFGY